MVDGFPASSTNGAKRRAKRQGVPIGSVQNLLSLMAHSQIILLRCLSNLSISQFSIPDEPFYHLSQLKFNGEDGTSIAKHIYDFLIFFESYEIDNEYFYCVLFFLTLEDRANKWCTLPSASFHYIQHFL